MKLTAVRCDNCSEAKGAMQMSETLPITVNVDADPGITNAPYWVIVDPERFKRDIKRHLEGDELESIDELSSDDLMSLLCMSFRGPFFSRDEAEKAFRMTVHCSYFTDAAEIYCLSGSSNPQYTEAYNEAVAKQRKKTADVAAADPSAAGNPHAVSGHDCAHP